MENTRTPLRATQAAPTKFYTSDGICYKITGSNGKDFDNSDVFFPKKERSTTHRVNEMALIAANTKNVYNSIINGQFKQSAEQLNEELEKIHGTLEDRQKADEYDIVDIKKGWID